MGGYILKTVSGTHIGVYILPRALYTNMTHRLIYLETMCNIEEKHGNKKNRNGKSNVGRTCRKAKGHQGQSLGISNLRVIRTSLFQGPNPDRC